MKHLQEKMRKRELWTNEFVRGNQLVEEPVFEEFWSTQNNIHNSKQFGIVNCIISGLVS